MQVNAMGRRGRRALLIVAVALGALLSPLPGRADTPPEREADSVVSFVESADFLKVPPGLPGKGFAVAQKAPTVDLTLFRGLPDKGRGTLWSSWGDGCLASNGKYYTSIGDHRGTDANSLVYEYDPQAKSLRLVVDVAQAIGQQPGRYGHGKIHSGIHEASDGWLYFSTYWGKPREVEAAFGADYQGSLLLRYHPQTGRAENLGAIVPRQGLPASGFDARRDLLYFHAVYKGDIVAYAVKAQKVKFLGGADQTEGRRTFLIDERGRAYFSSVDGTLHYYDPETNRLAKTTARLPASAGARRGDSLRAAAGPTRAGLLYGMTSAGRLFAFEPRTDKVQDLGPNFADGDYTAVMVLSPDEKYLYFAPGAHGSSGRQGTPVVQVDLASGRRKVLAFLNEPVRRKLTYNLGGTYNLQIDPRGERLFFTFNGAPYVEQGRKTETFGQPAVVVLHIPKPER
jgi:hypothetical protein